MIVNKVTVILWYLVSLHCMRCSEVWVHFEWNACSFFAFSYSTFLFFQIFGGWIQGCLGLASIASLVFLAFCHARKVVYSHT